MKCKLCNRPLKSKTSIAIGYGPTCLKKVGYILKKGKLIKRLDYYEKN